MESGPTAHARGRHGRRRLWCCGAVVLVLQHAVPEPTSLRERWCARRARAAIADCAKPAATDKQARAQALANEHAQQQEGGAADGARRSAADSGAVVGGAANKQGGTGAAAGMAALSQPPPPQDKSPPKGSAQVADLQMATPGASADTSPSQPAPRRDDPQAEDSAHPPQRPPVTAPDASKPPGPDDRRGVPAAPAASMVASAGQKGSGAGAPTTSKKAASISEAKPPTRPQCSGASMSTNDTLKMVSDKLAAWQASGASLNYGD